MNEAQRQILADAINRLSEQIDLDEISIANMEHRLANAKERLANEKKEKALLEEDIDW